MSFEVVASWTQVEEIIHVNLFFACDYFLSFNQVTAETFICQ